MIEDAMGMHQVGIRKEALKKRQHCAVPIRHTGTYSNQCIHIGGPVLQGTPGSTVERCPDPELYRRSQCPQDEIKLERGQVQGFKRNVHDDHDNSPNRASDDDLSSQGIYFFGAGKPLRGCLFVRFIPCHSVY